MKLGEAFRELHQEVEPHLSVDGIYVLDRGLITFHDRETGKIEPAPSPATDVVPIVSDQPLLSMLVQLQTLYQSAWSRPVIPTAYIEGENLGRSLNMSRPAAQARQDRG